MLAAARFKERSILTIDVACCVYSRLRRRLSIPAGAAATSEWVRAWDSCGRVLFTLVHVRYDYGFDYSIVMPNGYGINDVANPKDVVAKALSLGGNLGPQISGVAAQIELLAYMDNMADAVDAVSMPVLMFVQAVYSMQQVEDTADKIDQEKRKAIILAFIGAILFFIPIVGEVAGTVEGIGDLAAILSIVGDAGNAAMDIYTLVSDPQNAPLAIMGLIFAPAALADAGNLLKAANIRRGMEDAEIAKLGTKISDGMSTIRKINGKCVK